MELRGDDGIITGRRPHPRVFKLSYLLTVWTQRPEDEHRILSNILAHLVQHDVVPESFLQGTLVGSSQPVQLRVAQPPPQDRSVSDVWSAMGGELKPSLDLVVLAPLEAGVLAEAGPPVLEEPRFHFDPGTGAGEDRGGGRVERPTDEADDADAPRRTRRGCPCRPRSAPVGSRASQAASSASEPRDDEPEVSADVLASVDALRARVQQAGGTATGDEP